MSYEFFTLPAVDVTKAGYRMFEYSAAATGITPISFLIASSGFIYLERSYLEV